MSDYKPHDMLAALIEAGEIEDLDYFDPDEWEIREHADGSFDATCGSEEYLICPGINVAYQCMLERAGYSFDESIEMWDVTKLDSMFDAKKMLDAILEILGEEGKKKVVKVLCGMPAEKEDKNKENQSLKRQVIAEFLAGYDFKERSVDFQAITILAYRWN